MEASILIVLRTATNPLNYFAASVVGKWTAATRPTCNGASFHSMVGGETETPRHSPSDRWIYSGRRDGGTRRSSDEEAAAETRQAHLAVPSTIRSAVSRSGLAGHAYRHVIIYGPSCSRAYQEPCILIITSIDDIFTYIHIIFQ